MMFLSGYVASYGYGVIDRKEHFEGFLSFFACSPFSHKKIFHFTEYLTAIEIAFIIDAVKLIDHTSILH